MTKLPDPYRSTFCLVILSGILFTACNTQAQERTPVSEAISANTREFLSDPSRTGSLVGSILAGAAVANPLAPLLGSVAGFMIGKSSAFSNDNKAAERRRAYMNRSLAQESDAQIPGITGLTGTSEQQRTSEPSILLGMSGRAIRQLPQNHPGLFDRTTITGFPTDTDEGMESESARTATVAFDADIEALNDLQQQLSYSCGNSQITETLSMSCYYYSR